MRAIGIIGVDNHTTNRIISETKSLLVVYYLNVLRPLELIVHTGDKVSIMNRKEFPYLSPFSEIIKIDGPIYVCQGEGVDVGAILDELKDNTLNFDPDQPKPLIFVETI